MITLIRYKNRKVYDPTIKGYTTGQAIASMLVTRQKVRVLCHQTNVDVTHASLVNMGATMLRAGNPEAGRLLIRYADAYRVGV